MPSTYTNNLGVQKPADGEQDGVWGDVVNDNMDIIDRAINGSVTLTLTGTSSTLTTTDGTLSNGQYKVLILGGSPSGTHTITIEPNDAQKVYFVYNLSGQSVIFTQGSGTNVTIATSDTAVIYCNGGGASAGVVNLTDHFAMNSVKITGGTITGISDITVADGGTGVSTLTGIAKGNGTSPFSAAVAGTDYLAPAAIGATVQAWDANLDQIAALAPTTDNFIVGNGSAWVLETPVQALASLGVTSLAADLNLLSGQAAAGLTGTELGYVNGVTSPIQTQLDSISGSGTPAGAVMFFAMSTAPSGFLECAGQAVSRTTYAALFAAIGTLYGSGDGSTTFNLPNLRGEFIRGWDNGRGVDSGRSFGSAQSDAFQGHGHNLATQSNGPGGGTGTYAAGATNNTISIGAPITNGAFGTPRTAAETRPTNIALLPCIKV